MTNQTYEVTGAGVDPVANRNQRTRVYVISMSIRVACVLCLLFTPGWWAILPILGAALLPFFAVMVANNIAPVVDKKQHSTVTPLSLPDSLQKSASPEVIIIAAPKYKPAKQSDAE
ncbi:DUF3099 domain-containing protein [Canibacter sp. lx-72]|uniref:DUF3099 domain-containing protein n=1 Tax=Canibacter zhuwentaonis TaxID=2837491 RepID=UPI001BDD2A2B|nr:DUF3099 domain-containing protein [Canibacter zhuwentaonis]MBT1017838.1 DUF3099 domain-containing protein [Canibacter zhuwentaonis]MBT1035001.1 DUF3099 domain-containing protein [Canibacter zhuwentaonis]